jgi:membrane-bound serine protease (ClpP class)
MVRLPRSLVLRAVLVVALALPVLAALAPSSVAVGPAVARADEAADEVQAQVGAQAVPRRVEILPLRGGFLDPPVAAQVRDVLDLAAREGAELVVLQFDAAGGVSLDTAELVARIAASPVPVAVSVGPIGTAPEAAGAAAAVFLAAHVRAVAPDATVGPLAPLDLRALDAARPDAVDFLAATSRLAGARDAAPDAQLTALLDRMVDEAIDADALVAAGLARITTGIEPLLVELDGQRIVTVAGELELRLRPDEVQVRFHSLGLLRRMLHAASTAPFVYLLLVVGLGMLLFEVFQPGFGVAGLAGVITAGIAVVGASVLPVRWWAVALVVLGLLLYALDTAIAGFGPVTALATVAFAAGSWWFYAAPALQLSGWLVATATLSALVFFVLVMTTVLRAQAGPEGTDVAELVGRTGVVRSMLNPEGHVFIDGALWRARALGTDASGGVKVGTAVRVHAVDGPVILVDASGAARSTLGSGLASADGQGLVVAPEPS